MPATVRIPDLSTESVRQPPSPESNFESPPRLPSNSANRLLTRKCSFIKQFMFRLSTKISDKKV